MLEALGVGPGGHEGGALFTAPTKNAQYTPPFGHYQAAQ